MSSIRLFLTVSIISIVILANFLAAVKGYQSSMQKAEEIFDAKLLHIAKLLLSSNAFIEKNTNDNISENLSEKIVEKKPENIYKTLSKNSYDNISSEMLYIIKDEKNTVLSKSTQLVNFPATKKLTINTQFGWINYKRARWRQLDYVDPKKSLSITIIEKQTDRFLLAETVILESIYPILLAIPSIALVIFLIVGRGLKPLLKLSNKLKTKKANNLSPIELKFVPKELTQLNESLNHLLSRLDGAIIREKRFSADAAHELRTPITSLGLQMANLLHDITSVQSSDSEEVIRLKESVTDLSLGIQRMSHLVEQILTLNSISVDDYCDNFKRINLTSILRQTIAETYPLIENKNQSIELVVKSASELESDKQQNIEGSFHINGDEHGIACLFANLIENANKYTPQNGHIKVILRVQENSIIVSVIDSGQGISDQDSERIFDRFYRAGGDSHQSNVSGCGLGLSIVEEISSRHHAIINVFLHNKPQHTQNTKHLKKLFEIDFNIGLWLDVKFKLID